MKIVGRLKTREEAVAIIAEHLAIPKDRAEEELDAFVLEYPLAEWKGESGTILYRESYLPGPTVH